VTAAGSGTVSSGAAGCASTRVALPSYSALTTMTDGTIDIPDRRILRLP
jgi:hypothetical protein